MPSPRAAPALGLLLLALLACAAPRTSPGLVGTAGADDAAAQGQAVLRRFVRAVELGRWTEAWPLLSARWRAASSPERLAADYRAAGPVAREAVERLAPLIEAGAPLVVVPAGLRLELGEGRAARLVAEPGGWRVDALE